MIETIWKYPIDIEDSIQIRMPLGAKVLHVGVQDGVPTIWARVRPGDDDTELRHFTVVGTGHPIPIDEGRLVHLGTFFHGPFVWHLFEQERVTA